MKSDNLMRKKDEAPAAAKQIDTLMSCLQRHGMAKNAQRLTLEEVQQYIANDHPHYPMGLDVVDQIIGLIWNTMRINEGASELTELPVSLQVTPMFGEFEVGSCETEKKLMQDMGLSPMPREKGATNGGRQEMECHSPPVGEGGAGTSS